MVDYYITFNPCNPGKLLHCRTRLILLLMITCIINTSVKSQGITIKGVITDRVYPLSDVGILLLKDSIIVRSEVSDSMGNYSFTELIPGKYRLNVSGGFYRSHSFTVVLVKDTVISLYMERNVKELSEVSVVARKPLIERKIDRLVFNVSENPGLTGVEILDILKATPLLQVSNDEISIVGKDGVRVMLNGRLINLSGQDLLNYIRTIPTGNILKIEVITVPPSKYDAGGNAGLINIVTKNAHQNGQVTGSINSTYEQSYYPTTENSGSFASNIGNFDIDFSIAYRNGKKNPYEKINTTYTKQEWENIVYRKQSTNRLNINTGAGFRIDSTYLFTLQYTGSYSKPREDASGSSAIYTISQANLDSVLYISNDIDNDLKLHDFTLYCKRTSGNAKNVLELTADYLLYNLQKNQALQTNNYFPDKIPTGQETNDRSVAPQDIKLFTANVDYSWLRKWGEVQMGAKLSSIAIDNDFRYYQHEGDTFIEDTKRSNHFIYKENTQAIYVSSNFSVSKVLEFKLGLRGENTYLNGRSVQYEQINKSSYFKVFPTAFIQYKFKNDNTLNLTYGRRIRRPGYGELNPFRYYFNAYQYAEGNPYLKPSFSSNLEFNYTLKRKYIFSISYQKVDDVFLQTPFLDSAKGLINYTRGNAGHSSTLGASAIVPINIFSWLVSNNVVTGSVRSETSTLTNARLLTYKTAFFTFQTHNTFYLNSKKTIVGSAGFRYNSSIKRYIYETYPVYALDLGVKLQTNDRRFTIGFSAADAFYTNITRFSSLPNTITPIQSKIYPDSRLIRISLSYALGADKNGKKAKRSNNDETNRLQ